MTNTYNFHSDPEDHNMKYSSKDLKIILEDISHRIKEVLNDKLSESVWDSQDIDDVKDCIDILCDIKKINSTMSVQQTNKII